MIYWPILSYMKKLKAKRKKTDIKFMCLFSEE